MKVLLCEDERMIPENNNESDSKNYEISGDLDDFIFSFVDYYGPSE